MRVLATALTPVLSNVRSSCDLAGAWFVNSGIQEETGGVARYYRSDVAQNARVSTEITGYAVSTLLYLHRRSKDPVYLRAAERAGKFLIEAAWSPGLAAFPFEHSLRDAPKPLAYFFDCGIIVRALVRLADATRESEYLYIAVKAGRSMAADFAAGSSSYHPVIELPGKAPLAYTSQWSRSPGCYQLKSALAWHDLSKATGSAEFEALYQSAVAAAIKAKDSFLPADTPEATMDRLHAYAYFLEGLLPLAGRSDCAAALAEGLHRISNYLRSIRPVFERSDVYAQLLRARLFANQLSVVPVNRAAAEDERAQIVDFQLADEDSRIDGGFSFGRKGDNFMPYVNPVSTAFCLQALEMWNDFESGETLDLATLI